MGCHTLFYRPTTKEEMNELINNSYQMLLYSFVTDPFYRNINDTDDNLINELCKNINGLKPYFDYAYTCVIEKKDPLYLIRAGYGAKDGVYTRCIKDKVYIEVSKYNDLFRINNYPGFVIYNKKQLRRKLRKRYFELDSSVLCKLSEFWSENPGGIIVFG